MLQYNKVFAESATHSTSA